MNLKDLLDLKKKMNAKRPVFKRQELGQRREIKSNWRRPRGLHSKMRHGFQGHNACVEIGYRSPSLLRGCTEDGFKINVISNVNDAEQVDVKNSVVVLAKGLGDKKKVLVVKKLLEKKAKILNLADPEQWLKNVENELNTRKNKKKEIKKNEKKEEKQVEKKSEKTELKNEEKNEEEKKKEFDKLLTKREE